MNEKMKKRILFVDDEPMILNGLQRTLRKMRHEWEMMFVSSATEALQILDANPMDVVVTDLKMPEMDGSQGNKKPPTPCGAHRFIRSC